MMTLTAPQKLDVVLKYIRDNEAQSIRSLIEILGYMRLTYNPEFTQQELSRIIRKLKEDKHIEDEGTNYKITFDGYLFIGYEAMALRDANEALLIEMEVKRRVEVDSLLGKNSTDLNTLTSRLLTWNRIAVLIGILVLAYYILTWFCPHYSDCLCNHH